MNWLEMWECVGWRGDEWDKGGRVVGGWGWREGVVTGMEECTLWNGRGQWLSWNVVKILCWHDATIIPTDDLIYTTRSSIGMLLTQFDFFQVYVNISTCALIILYFYFRIWKCPGVWFSIDISYLQRNSFYCIHICVYWFKYHYFFFNGSINNKPSLVQIMAWCWTSDKLLSEPMKAY